MNRHALAALVGVLVVASTLVGGGVLFVDEPLSGGTTGTDDAKSRTDDATTGIDSPTVTTDTTVPETTDSTSATTHAVARGTTEPDYDFVIERVERCGNTCRDVTARLANAGPTTRENVRVTTKVFADGDLLWSGTEPVGTLAPGEPHTSTRRVNVGLSGGLAISANDGHVTIVTVVQSDAGTVRFESRRKVA